MNVIYIITHSPWLIILVFWAFLGAQTLPGLRVGLWFDEEPCKLSFAKQLVIAIAIGPVLWVYCLLLPFGWALRMLWRMLP